MEITASERIMMTGLLAREREIQREHLAPLNADYTLVARMIEARLELAPGSIGTQYSIDVENGVLVENASPPGQTIEPLPTGLGDNNASEEPATDEEQLSA